eukprot:jgi/Chrzof1/7023/Cz02g07290.t1
MLQASPPGHGVPLLLSLSSTGVKLWRATAMDAGPMHTFEDLDRGSFQPQGTQVVGVNPEEHQAVLYDVNTGRQTMGLDSVQQQSGVNRRRHQASAFFSPIGELVLYGAIMWDPRVPAALHTSIHSDSQHSQGVFNPSSLEVIMNSESHVQLQVAAQC